MNHTVIMSLHSNLSISSLQNKLACDIGNIDISVFPDGESHIRIDANVTDKLVFLITDLSHPNDKIINVLFVSESLKERGAKQIILVTPYLPYMRQDAEFHAGEIVSAREFASMISQSIDGLITIDPHLHRIHQLNEIYPLPVISTLHATRLIAEWISSQTKNVFLLGPDEESHQWLSDIASQTGCDFAVAKKIRLGDREVMITLPETLPIDKPIIIIDDIISSGSSILTLVNQLSIQGIQRTSCITVHALFNKDMYDKLLNAGLTSLISTNSIPHFTNKIDVSPLIADEIIKLAAAFPA